jgi:hypothetical protein
LSVDTGHSLAPAQLAEMGGWFASFLEFRDDRIVSQRGYDCFDLQ